jgi:cobalamin biosynthesis protein CobW
MAEKIPATVITGFLGAGKTSLIRHLVENNKGRRLAFLINEFGDLGIDRELLLGCGIESCNEENVVELANGCICCTVADDFLPAMESLLARDDQPDHILIETSGLALPKPLVTAFKWPEIRSDGSRRSRSRRWPNGARPNSCASCPRSRPSTRP